MNRKSKINNELIIETANQLIYEQGYNQTSFADIATQLGITKGNLQYHFKSKEDILNAVLEMRKAQISAKLRQWDDEIPEPLDKIRRFIKMLLKEEKNITRFGCPMGTLNMELGKFQQNYRDRAREMFELYRHWLEKTFQELGLKNKQLGKQLLSRAQGAALLSFVYDDTNILKQECRLMNQWIDTLFDAQPKRLKSKQKILQTKKVI